MMVSMENFCQWDLKASQRILMKYDLIFDVKWGMQMEHETDNKDKESLR